MDRRIKGWLAVAVLFGLGNVAGAVMACVSKEWMHAATHAVLVVFSAYAVRELIDARPRPPVAIAADVPIGLVEDRLAHLELSLDGLATGVERMGEGQRSITRLFAERGGVSELRDHVERE